MRGYCAVVFSKSTQSNIILLLKKGNHGNYIFQVGDSLDRHAFQAPFFSSRKWTLYSIVFNSTQAGVARQRRLEQLLSPTLWKGKILLHDSKYSLLHTLHIQQTLKYHCVLVDSATDACTGLLFCYLNSVRLRCVAPCSTKGGIQSKQQYGQMLLIIDFFFFHPRI